MSVRASGAVAALSLFLMLAPPSAHDAAARGPVALRLGPGSSLWLDGTSNLHDFESRTAETKIAITRDSPSARLPESASLRELVRASAIRSVDVTVPVMTLRSGKSGLDKNLWKALKTDKYKTITVHVDRYTLSPKVAVGDTITLTANGTIVVSGAQRPIALTARMYAGSGGLWLEGREVLRMTEFGIKPPTMMLGTIRTADRITIHYRLLLSGHDAGSTSSNSGH